MNVSDMLLNYAIESGVIEDPVVAEDGLIEQDASELLDAKVDEICRASELVESLEALADRYSQIPVSDVSFESYQFTLGHILTVSGIDIPTSVVCPSFESAEKSEGKSFKEKAKGTIAAIIKWIKEQFGKLRDFVLRRKKATETKEKEAEATQKKAEAAVVMLQHKPRKGYAPAQHEGDEKASGKHGNQNGERATMPKHDVDADGKAINRDREEAIRKDRAESSGNLKFELPVLKLPKWMVEDGRFSKSKIEAFLKAARDEQLVNLIEGKFPDGSLLKTVKDWKKDRGDMQRWLRIDHSAVVRDTLGKATPGVGTVDCHSYHLGEIGTALTRLSLARKDAYAWADVLRKFMTSSERDAIRDAQRVEKGARNFDTRIISEELKMFKIRTRLAENAYTFTFGAHRALADALVKAGLDKPKSA